MPIVKNKRFDTIEKGDVYVGRPTKWGNPFTHLSHGAASFKVATRAEAIEKHRAWLLQQPELMAALPELRGKNLVCWCAPQACHAHTLMELANASSDHQP